MSSERLRREYVFLTLIYNYAEGMDRLTGRWGELMCLTWESRSDPIRDKKAAPARAFTAFVPERRLCSGLSVCQRSVRE